MVLPAWVLPAGFGDYGQMPANARRQVVVYARISVSRDESVSIDRQIEACRKYAEARGWEVIATIVDDGLSATKNRPEDRKGWRDVLSLSEPYAAVVVWKVDRLARRTLDFLHADQALQGRGAGLVAVEQPIDMTTATGRAFATMLAVFAELEAEAISSRVAAARTHLIKAGRVVGGTVPYGYRSIDNPHGPGKVLAQDAETIAHVRGAVRRALDGYSIYSIQVWLNEIGAPLPAASQKNRKREGWHYSTVERLLRSPVLAGMVPFNPGNTAKVRGADVLRDEQGMPVIDEALAIISAANHRRLLALLDDRTSPQAQPRAGKRVTSPLLSGLATCGACDRTMVRGTTAGRPCLTCPSCHQTMSTVQLTEHLTKRLLDERGGLRAIEVEHIVGDPAAGLAEIEVAINDTLAAMGRDGADIATLSERLASLKDLRSTARRTPVTRRVRTRELTVAEEWQAAHDDTERRRVLMIQIESLRILRGKVGRYLDPARVQVTWREPADVPAGADIRASVARKAITQHAKVTRLAI